MAKQKQIKQDQAEAVPAADAESTEALKSRIASLEAKVKSGEEGALSRVCKAMGVEPDAVTAKEADKKPEVMVRCFVMTEVKINGRTYHGDVTVPHSTFEVLSQAVGDRRMRHLRELTGNNYMLKELASGGLAPHVVGKVDASGERIS